MTSVNEAGQAFETIKSAARDCSRPDQHQACLVYIYPTGPLMGRRYPLGGGGVLIGRTDNCQVQNPDGSVSRHHARVEFRDGRFLVSDLGSTNGTFVNNVRRTVGELADGDYLRIGNCIYRFLAGGNIETEYHEEIYRLTVLDGLTGVPNRRHFEEFLDREVARTARHRRPLALAMVDVDHFKQVNDRLGHVAGDLTLRQVAAVAAANVRRDELFARYGGEEFALVLPEVGAAQAAVACERVRAAVAAHEFVFNAQPYRVTVSVGVGVVSGREAATPADLVRQADAQLYRAKAAGRNRVCTPDDPGPIE